MDPIGSFSGLASGIQWRDMVEQIMKMESARKLTPVKDQLSLQEKRQTAWNSFGNLVTKLSDATKRLRDGTAFSAFKTSAGKSASGKELVTATAGAGAAPGAYRVEVVRLARADKLNGALHTSATEALGLSGEFHVNGKRVTVTSGDTLSTLRDRINAANTGTTPSGVTATIISTGPSAHRLVLTADGTGSRGVELVDDSDGVLQGLGFVSGSLTQNTSPTDSSRTESQRFASKSTVLSTALGLTAPPAKTTVNFGGVKVEVDLVNDTLISVMNRVNSQDGDASMVEETVGGQTRYRLSVEGQVTADETLTGDAAARSQRIVELLGFQRGVRSHEITAGQDAVLRVDGFTMKRRTNIVADAIAGVTLNLQAANGSERTASVTGTGLSVATDPQTIDAGSYNIALTSSSTTRTVTTSDPSTLAVVADPGVADGSYAVSLTTTTTRSTDTTSASLQVVAAPGTVAAGSYSVSITTPAARATATGTVVSGNYNQSGDSITFVDNVAGVTQTYGLTNGQSLNSVVAGLNTMFTSNGMGLTASNNGGKLEVKTAAYGSAHSFTVTTSATRVSNFYGIGSTSGSTHTGTDVAGSIAGTALTGSGQVLTTAAGLQVRYTGTSAASPAGTVTVTDTTAISGGTIGGQAATWDSSTNPGRLTVSSGTLAGLSVSYSGAVTSGNVGTVNVSTTGTASITAVTIDGETAEWDPVDEVIRGTAGSRFEGLVLGYEGPAVTGSIGTLTVSGDIGVDVKITQDPDSTVDAVQKFAAAYNDLVKFAESQRQRGAPLYANGTLTALMSTLRNPLISDVTGLTSADSPYVRGGNVGVALSKTGQLEVDAPKLKSALTTNLADVRRLFGVSGSGSVSDLQYFTSTDATQPGKYAVNVSQLATQAAVTGSSLGSGWSYTAGDSVSDSLTVTDAFTGKSKALAVKHGWSLERVVSELNSVFQNEGMSLAASVSGTSVRIASTEYGSGGGFTLAGAAAAAGLGLSESSWSGVDAAGTFTDTSTSQVYTATGKGQMLTGPNGSVTEGLTVRYRGTATGAVGTLTFTLGLAGSLLRRAEPMTRTGDGAIVGQTDLITRSMSSLNSRVSDIEARLEVRRRALLVQFTRMEEAMSRFQTQSSWLSAQIGSLSGLNGGSR